MTLSMPKIGPDDWRSAAAPRADAALWTAVVPAAGRGSRLGFDQPKILYPLAGRLILDWLLDALTPSCSKVVLVLSPSGAAQVTRALEERIPGRYQVVIQKVPTGMGDAVSLGLAAVDTPHVAVVWGDQAALKPSSVEACLRLHQGTLAPELTVPTVLRAHPYIHFDRNESGMISGLRQLREGDVMPAIGETDTGFFCFRAQTLRTLLESLRHKSRPTGALTGEFNLLPVIPEAARQGRLVLTPRVVSIEETVGVNSPEDASTLENYLRRCA